MWVVSWVVDYTSFIILSHGMAFDIVMCEYLIGAEGTPWGFVCNPNVMPSDIQRSTSIDRKIGNVRTYGEDLGVRRLAVGSGSAHIAVRVCVFFGVRHRVWWCI